MRWPGKELHSAGCFGWQGATFRSAWYASYFAAASHPCKLLCSRRFRCVGGLCRFLLLPCWAVAFAKIDLASMTEPGQAPILLCVCLSRPSAVSLGIKMSLKSGCVYVQGLDPSYPLQCFNLVWNCLPDFTWFAWTTCRQQHYLVVGWQG